MRQLRLLFEVSRWRFWAYLAGPYLVGYVAGIRELVDFGAPLFWALLIFFLWPANVLLYGANDLGDRDTDALNPKKGSTEHRLQNQESSCLLLACAVSMALGLGLAMATGSLPVFLSMALFLLLALAYSLPPLRLKSRIVLDAAANCLYALPLVAGYAHAAGSFPPFEAFLVGALWSASMQLFSAVPDIEADFAAGLRTSAVALGRRGSLLVCALLWLAAVVLAVLAFERLRPWSLLGVVYPLVPMGLLGAHDLALVRVYWLFPVLNTLVGMVLFFVVSWRLLPW